MQAQRQVVFGVVLFVAACYSLYFCCVMLDADACIARCVWDARRVRRREACLDGAATSGLILLDRAENMYRRGAAGCGDVTSLREKRVLTNASRYRARHRISTDSHFRLCTCIQ